MKSPDVIDVICFMPIIVIYAFVELKRGWSILRHGEYSINPALQARIWLLRHLRGDDFANEYRRNILIDHDAMRQRGVYSLVGAAILLIGSAILIVSWLI
jgi:hypothetical protein